MEQQLPAPTHPTPGDTTTLHLNNPSFSTRVDHLFPFLKARELFNLDLHLKPSIFIVSLWVADKHGECLNFRPLDHLQSAVLTVNVGSTAV